MCFLVRQQDFDLIEQRIGDEPRDLVRALEFARIVEAAGIKVAHWHVADPPNPDGPAGRSRDFNSRLDGINRIGPE